MLRERPDAAGISAHSILHRCVGVTPATSPFLSNPDLVCVAQGYRDALAWLLKNGKIPYGVPGASEEGDTADSAGGGEGLPAWRQRLNDTLASVQAQVS